MNSLPENVRAVTFSEFGGPNVLKISDIPRPEPHLGEILVKVAAATVNPTDRLMRSGRQTALMQGLAPPFIAGTEFAGYVVGFGENDVTAIGLGSPVLGVVNPRRPRGGAHAEYISIPLASIARLEKSDNLEKAATIGMNGLTAKMAVEAVNMPKHAVVLISGGAGAVGGYAVTLARRAGLTVIADGHPADADILRQLGADCVVTRGENMFQEVKALFPRGVDGLIDAALIGKQAAALVRDAGTAVSLRVSHTFDDPRLVCRYVNFSNGLNDSDSLRLLAELYDRGSLMPRVARTFSIAEASTAHEFVERGGQRGRIVLVF